MGCEISDEEFDMHCDAVYSAWKAGGVDTVDIAQKIGISEAKIDWILSCCREAKFDQMEEAREELEKWSDFDPASVVSQTSAEHFKAMVVLGLRARQTPMLDHQLSESSHDAGHSPQNLTSAIDAALT